MIEITVHIGSGLDDQGIKDALASNAKRSPLYGIATAIMSANRDWRVQVHNVEVEDVYIDTNAPNQVQIEFTIGWSLYHGCKDKDETDDELVSEVATYTAEGDLIFIAPEPTRPDSNC